MCHKPPALSFYKRGFFCFEQEKQRNVQLAALPIVCPKLISLPQIILFEACESIFPDPLLRGVQLQLRSV